MKIEFSKKTVVNGKTFRKGDTLEVASDLYAELMTKGVVVTTEETKEDKDFKQITKEENGFNRN